jgi:hypothetical protein
MDGAQANFHVGNTGSNPVGDANEIKHFLRYQYPRWGQILQRSVPDKPAR